MFYRPFDKSMGLWIIQFDQWLSYVAKKLYVLAKKVSLYFR